MAFPEQPIDPPGAPPGNPLLNTDESSHLNNFWDNPDASTADMPSDLQFGAGFGTGFDQKDAGSIYGFYNHNMNAQNHMVHSGIHQDNSMLAHPRGQLDAYQPTSGYSMNTFSGQHFQSNPADLMAASILVGPQMQSFQNSHPTQDLHSPLHSSGRQSVGSYTPTMTSHPQYEVNTHGMDGGIHHGSMDSGMGYYNTMTSLPQRTRHSVPDAHSLPFGTDRRFSGHGFVAPYQGSHNETAHNLMGLAQAYDLHRSSGVNSVENTYATNPVIHSRDHATPAKDASRISNQDEDEDHEDDEPLEQPKPKKRRKTKTAEDDDQDYKPGGSGGRLGSKAADAESPSDVPESSAQAAKKRRRSSAGGSAPGPSASKAGIQRRNLTNEEKRQNHINSEQKRRNIISDHFHQIRDLVPNLSQANHNKALALTEAAKYLEELVDANQGMEARLEALRKAQEVGG